MKKGIHLLIAEPCGLYRKGLRLILGEERCFMIMGEAASAAELFPSLETQPCDILLLNFMLPGKGGFELLEVVKKKFPGTKVILVGSLLDDRNLVFSVKAGAWGYLPPRSTEEGLVRAIEKVNQGETWFPHRLIPLIPMVLENEKNLEIDLLECVLTPQEKEVFRLLMDGNPNKTIAYRLGCSDKTVKIHLTSIYKKINVNNRYQAIALGIRARF